MATIIKKKKKNQLYYYLVESARIDGKPRIVHQQYLGRAEEIAKKCSRSTDLDTPKYSIPMEFGAVCALYEIARELRVVELIDEYARKRNQDLSIGSLHADRRHQPGGCPHQQICRWPTGTPGRC